MIDRIGSIAGATFQTAAQIIKWMGHVVIDLTKAAWDLTKGSSKFVIQALTAIVGGVVTIAGKLFAVTKSPLGIAAGSAVLAGWCVKKSQETHDDVQKVCYGALGLGSAFVTGIMATMIV